jgi:hypothetical protein
MAARVRIDTPTQRLRLKARREPYWVKLQARGYLGFRRTADGGTWVARWRDDQGKQHYRALRLAMEAPERAYDEAAASAQETGSSRPQRASWRAARCERRPTATSMP